jgi:hypothetical protein
MEADLLGPVSMWLDVVLTGSLHLPCWSGVRGTYRDRYPTICGVNLHCLLTFFTNKLFVIRLKLSQIECKADRVAQHGHIRRRASSHSFGTRRS